MRPLAQFARPFLALAAALAVMVAMSACGKDDGKLRIKKLAPKTGPYSGGSAVTIHGTGFQKGGMMGVKVYFGDKAARVLAFDGDTRLRVEPPSGKVNEKVSVTLIFDDAREFTLKDAYTYIDLTQGFGVDKLAPGDEKK